MNLPDSTRAALDLNRYWTQQCDEARQEGAAVAFGLMGIGFALQNRLCRCDEYFAWCVVHDTCPRCAGLLFEPQVKP